MKTKFKFLFIILVLTLCFSLSLKASDFNFYGFLKLNTAYDSGYSYPGNFVLFEKDPGFTKNLFYISANESRFGMNISGNKVGDFNLSGKVEIDFMGGGAENKAHIIMRHAYLKLKKDNFTIIAGQTWDIISPLNPVSLNYSVMWMAGNIGYRRAQLRMEDTIKIGNNDLKIQAGIFRTIGGDFDLNGIDDGVSSGTPTIQGRVSTTFNILESSVLQIGISGHYGKDKSYFNKEGKSWTTNSINFDFLLKISETYKIMGEFFSGKNLGSFLGGIGQTVNLAKQVEIGSKGGFIDLVFTPTKELTISGGYGVDTPNEDDLSVGNKSKNSVIFGNIILFLNKALKIGVELDRWKTEYFKQDSFSSTRFQFSIYYIFK
jgi:hypothetical protein